MSFTDPASSPSTFASSSLITYPLNLLKLTRYDISCNKHNTSKRPVEAQINWKFQKDLRVPEIWKVSGKPISDETLADLSVRRIYFFPMKLRYIISHRKAGERRYPTR